MKRCEDRITKGGVFPDSLRRRRRTGRSQGQRKDEKPERWVTAPRDITTEAIARVECRSMTPGALELVAVVDIARGKPNRYEGSSIHEEGGLQIAGMRVWGACHEREKEENEKGSDVCVCCHRPSCWMGPLVRSWTRRVDCISPAFTLNSRSSHAHPIKPPASTSSSTLINSPHRPHPPTYLSSHRPLHLQGCLTPPHHLLLDPFSNRPAASRPPHLATPSHPPHPHPNPPASNSPNVSQQHT